MRKVLLMSAVAVAIGVAGCTSSDQASTKKAKSVKPAKPHIQAVFKKGSKVCNWSDSKGKKGTDYFYKDKTAMSGSADRVMGNDMKQGTWQITGSAMNLNWYGGKKGKGRWYKVEKTGKKSFNLSTSDGSEKYSVKCK